MRGGYYFFFASAEQVPAPQLAWPVGFGCVWGLGAERGAVVAACVAVGAAPGGAAACAGGVAMAESPLSFGGVASGAAAEGAAAAADAGVL